MSALDQIQSERLKKISRMREEGGDPYPAESFRTHENAKFLASFEVLVSAGETVTLAGRVMSLRDQGGLVFLDLHDGTARVQVLLKKDDMDEKSFALFMEVVDTSDFVEITGTAFTTKRSIT